MTGLASASEVVIVHRWQVIMDQRLGMDHLNGTRRSNELVICRAECPPKSEHDRRTKMLSAGKQAPANCVAQALRRTPGGRDQPFKFRVYERGDLREEGVELGHFLKDKG